MKRVGLVGWRGMVGSVLMQRMMEERDFDHIEPIFFTTSQVGGKGPAIGRDVPALQDARDVDALRTMDIVISCQGGDYTTEVFPRLRGAGWSGHWIDAASSLRMKDDTVIIPYTSHLRRVTRRQYLNSIIVQAATAEQIPHIQQQMTDLLQQRRSGREPDFTVRSQVELAQAATATSRTMTWLLGAIAGVSLVVGGIGIMNIMLVSVTERTREIGIRLAIGAHGKEIMLQFLTESVVLSAFGGTLGILTGIGASKLMTHFNGWPTLVSTNAIVIAFVFSAAVGIFFGFYPARKAARLDPIEALRYE